MYTILWSNGSNTALCTRYVKRLLCLERFKRNDLAKTFYGNQLCTAIRSHDLQICRTTRHRLHRRGIHKQSMRNGASMYEGLKWFVLKMDDGMRLFSYNACIHTYRQTDRQTGGRYARMYVCVWIYIYIYIYICIVCSYH